MRRRPTDHAAGSGFFRYRLRSGCWPRMKYAVFKVREESALYLPLAISEESSLFEPPETGNSEKLFLLALFGKISAVLNERKLRFSKKSFLIHKPESPMIRTPENTKIPEFFSLTSFGVLIIFLNERKQKTQKKALKVGCMRRYCHSKPDFQGFFAFGKRRPPAP